MQLLKASNHKAMLHVLFLELEEVCPGRVCGNGGTCLVGEENFQCTCAPGYTGGTCQGKVLHKVMTLYCFNTETAF